MVGEEGVLSCGNFIAQSCVIEDKLVMGGWEFGCELGFDVVPVVGELFLTVGEGETDCLRGPLPSGGPLSSSGYSLFGFSNSKSDFHFAQVTHSLFIRDNMVERRKDVVEVNGIPFEDTLPL